MVDSEADGPQDDDKKNYLRRRRGGYKGSITRISNKFAADPDVTTGQLEAWLKSIQHTFNGFDEVQTKLEVTYPDEQGQGDEDATERVEFLEAYEELEGRLREAINQRQHVQNNSQQSSSVTLPTFQVPQYDGSIIGWLSFKKTFPELVGKKPIDSVTKLSILIDSCSKGTAAQLVVSASDYETAWSRLEELNSSSSELQNYVMDQLYDIVTPKENDKSSLTIFLSTLEANLAHLTSISIDYSTWDLILVHHLARRLDNASRREMEKLRKPNEILKLSQFIAFLKDRIRLLGITQFKPSATSTPKQQLPVVKKVSTMSASTTQQSPPQPTTTHQTPLPNTTATCTTSTQNQQTPASSAKQHRSLKSPSRECYFCRKIGHAVWSCELAKALTPAQRKQKVTSSNLCINCLNPSHQVAQCTSVNRCRTCGHQHHTLLHDAFMTSASPAPRVTASAYVSASTASESHPVVLATAIIFIKNCHGDDVPCRAFLDSGSTASFISERLTHILQLTKQRTNATVVGINGTVSSSHHMVDTSIKSRCTSFECQLQFLVTQTIVGKLPSRKIDTSELRLPLDVIMADPTFETPSNVDVLLGSDVFYSVLKGTKTQLGNGLWLIDTEFGAIVGGKVTTLPQHHQSYSAITELTSQLKRFWEVETLSTPKLSIEERAAEAHYSATTCRLPSGRYQVALPFNDRKSELGESREMARRIYFGSERRLIMNPEKYRHYQEFMMEMINLGHMEKATDSDADEYFMTHHLVTRLESVTTKHRVVFNASKTSSTGVSLNDVLLVGPVVQPDLFTHLLRWREQFIGVSADITKMYRMIEVRPEDRKYQRIWWRQTAKQPPEAYQLTTVTYGTASAPYQATKTLLRLAEDESQNYLDVATMFAKGFYVDDLCSSFANERIASHTKQRLKQLAAAGGFELRKWSSNAIDVDDHFTEDEVTTVLGISWNKHDDKIQLNFLNVTFNDIVTKSSVLSSIAQIHDPLGLLSPVVLRAKQYMQRLFEYENISWTSALPEDFVQDWQVFAEQMQTMPTIHVSRALLPSGSEEFDLHGFADASNIGYGACVYVVTNNSSNLICAKSRIAPIKRLTTPRLELCAALLLAELIQKVSNACTKSYRKIYLWSDSEITIFRIKSSAAKYNIYVGSRVAEIQNLTHPSDWYHIPTKENPADIISRGLNPHQIENSTLWWSGPAFLTEGIQWPDQQKFNKDVTEIESELKTCGAAQIKQKDDSEDNHKSMPTDDLCSIISKFSSFDRLVGALAQVLRLRINATKPLVYRNFNPIDTQEREEVIIRLIRAVQSAAYGNEIQAFQENKQISNRSSLLKLHPFLDSDHLLRVGGRLKHAKLTFDQQHQIILPKGHFSSLILYRIHWDNMHCGPQLMLATARQRYWIISARNESKKICHICIRCFRHRPILLQQLMGNVPSLRTNPARPFINTGVDFAGPFQVRTMPRSKTIIKVYVSLFTCLVTRATHLELVSDLSTVGFLAAFRRFIARRGTPAVVYSDNATNFIGARNELEELKKLSESNQSKQFYSVRGIKWQTIPPRSPHWGGAWEALVKQFKHHLRRVTNGQIFYMEGLHTVICQIEAILNSRPLTPMTSDPSDFRALTPGHFLIGEELNLLPEPIYSDTNFNRLEAWQQRQYLVGQLW